jgi:hypothetical protein
MFEKTSRLAERLASSVSRRGFLGSLGGWAAAAAMSVAGVLAGATAAQAGSDQYCCYYAACGSCVFPGVTCTSGGTRVSYCTIILTPPGGSCPATYGGCPLDHSVKEKPGVGCKC